MHAHPHVGFPLSWWEHELSRTLSHKIRAATLAQIARTWLPSTRPGLDYVANKVRRLIQHGSIESFRVRTHPELALDAPVWTWKPDDPEPPYGRLSYQLRVRFTEPLRPTTVYVASEKSARRYAGAGGRLPHPLQATHDLHVAAIYLRLLKERPSEAAGWVPESALAGRRRGQKLPDAEIHDADGRPVKVIEFGGAYPPERIQKVHEDCVRRQLPYELW
jgi:hypothetical protein